MARVVDLTQRNYAYARGGAGFHGSLANVDVSFDANIDHINIDKAARTHNRAISEVMAVVGHPSAPPKSEGAPVAAKPTSAEPTSSTSMPDEGAKASPSPATAAPTIAAPEAAARRASFTGAGFAALGGRSTFGARHQHRKRERRTGTDAAACTGLKAGQAGCTFDRKLILRRD